MQLLLLLEVKKLLKLLGVAYLEGCLKSRYYGRSRIYRKTKPLYIQYLIQTARLRLTRAHAVYDMYIKAIQLISPV